MKRNTMQAITSITQKGQVTIPKAIRDYFAIKTNDSVLIEKDGDHISIKPVPGILELIGTLKPRENVGVDPLKAREQLEESYERF